MKIAIMQPYFFPYIGYFQLIQSVDLFVVYDNIKYTKKGWINRNRYLLNGKDSMFTIPLEKDSDFLTIIERSIATDFNKKKLLSQIFEAYRRAPYFKQAFTIFEESIMFAETNLFRFIYSSLKRICSYLNLDQNFVVSSTVNIDHDLRAQDKVLAICKSLGATQYHNAIGGQDLYDFNEFKMNGIELRFVKSSPLIYDQQSNEFVPWLSILDLMMFNSNETLKGFLRNYELI